MQLSEQDRQHLRAADGWMALGDCAEASQELERVSPESRQHPEVLQVRWGIAVKLRDWEKSLEVAEALVNTAPERFFGWLHKAISLRRLERPAEAKAVLLAAAARFEASPTMAYYLACYCCQLGQSNEARRWLEKAFELTVGHEQKHKLKARVLNEPDLQPLWNR